MLVQIFASSAWTGVVLTIGAPNSSNVLAARSVEASPTPPMMQGSVEISSRKRPAAIRSGAWATNMSSPTFSPRRFSTYPATNSVVPGAIVERRISVWPGRSSGIRSSTAALT